MNGRDRVWLAALAIIFLAWHVPLMFRTPPGQDEDWYGVVGITILRTGLPQIPYLPSRDPNDVCYMADVAVYVLPPLSFYLQSVVHLVLGDGVGQARLTSGLLGLAAIYLVYRLSLAWFDDRRGALLAATAYSLSRAFLFPATTARPDMAATTLGLLGIWWVVGYRRAPRRRSAAITGAFTGLSLLSHPFGIVPVTQAGLAILAQPGPARQRLIHASLYAAVALAAFSLWLPLIALHPDLFRIQFGNILHRAGSGLAATLASPLPVVMHQGRQIWGHILPLQAVLYALGFVWAFARAWRSPENRAFLYHLCASLLLLILFEGRHPTLGYYSFPAAFACVAVGMLASEASGCLVQRLRPGGKLTGCVGFVAPVVVLAAVLLPGAGLRAFWVQITHWRDPAHNYRLLSRTLMNEIPADRLAAVDRPFVMDFYLAGRPVVAAAVYPTFFDVRTQPFDYVVFGHPGLKQHRASLPDLKLIRTYGDPTDPFGAYAELYQRNTGNF